MAISQSDCKINQVKYPELIFCTHLNIQEGKSWDTLDVPVQAWLSATQIAEFFNQSYLMNQDLGRFELLY